MRMVFGFQLKEGGKEKRNSLGDVFLLLEGSLTSPGNENKKIKSGHSRQSM
jgi:hypothetical protein